MPIEFTGDSSQLEQAILRVERGFSAMSTRVEQLTKTLGLQHLEFQNVEKDLNSLNAEFGRLKVSQGNLLGQLNTLSAEYGKLSTELKSTQASLARLEAQKLRSISSTNSLVAVEKNLQGVFRGTSGALGSLWLSYGAILPMMASFSAASMAIKSIKLGSEFEYLTTYGHALSDMSTPLSEIRKELLAMEGVAQTPTALAEGFLELQKAGFSTADALKELGTISKYAAVADQDLKTSAEQLVTIFNSYRDTTLDANGGLLTLSSTADIVAAAAQGSVASFTDMQTALKYLSALSTNAQMSLQEVAAGAMVMHDAGKAGSLGATAMRTAFTRMLDPTDKFNKLLEQAGVKMESFASGDKIMSLEAMVNELARVREEVSREEWIKLAREGFGLRGELVMDLISNTDKFRESMDKLLDSMGFVDRVFTQLSGTSKILGVELKAAFEKALIEAFNGEKATEILTRLKDLVSSPDFSSSITGLMDAVFRLGEVLTKVTAGFVELPGAIQVATLALVSFGGIFGKVASVMLFGASNNVEAAEKLGSAWTDASLGIELSGVKLKGVEDTLTSTYSATSTATTNLASMNEELKRLEEWRDTGKGRLWYDEKDTLASIDALKTKIKETEEGFNESTREAQRFGEGASKAISSVQGATNSYTSELEKSSAAEQVAALKIKLRKEYAEVGAAKVKSLADAQREAGVSAAEMDKAMSYLAQSGLTGVERQVAELTAAYEKERSELAKTLDFMVAHGKITKEQREKSLQGLYEDYQLKVEAAEKSNQKIEDNEQRHQNKLQDLYRSMDTFSENSDNASYARKLVKLEKEYEANKRFIEEEEDDKARSIAKLLQLEDNYLIAKASLQEKANEKAKALEEELDAYLAVSDNDVLAAKMSAINREYQAKKRALDDTVVTEEFTAERIKEIYSDLEAWKAKKEEEARRDSWKTLQEQLLATGKFADGVKAALLEIENDYTTMGDVAYQSIIAIRDTFRTQVGDFLIEQFGGIEGAWGGLWDRCLGIVGNFLADLISRFAAAIARIVAIWAASELASFFGWDTGAGSFLGEVFGLGGGNGESGVGSILGEIGKDKAGDWLGSLFSSSAAAAASTSTSLGAGTATPAILDAAADSSSGWGSALSTVGGVVGLAGGAYGLYSGISNMSKGNYGTGAVQTGLGAFSAYQGATTLGLIEEGAATAAYNAVADSVASYFGGSTAAATTTTTTTATTAGTAGTTATTAGTAGTTAAASEGAAGIGAAVGPTMLYTGIVASIIAGLLTDDPMGRAYTTSTPQQYAEAAPELTSSLTAVTDATNDAIESLTGLTYAHSNLKNASLDATNGVMVMASALSSNETGSLTGDIVYGLSTWSEAQQKWIQGVEGNADVWDDMIAQMQEAAPATYEATQATAAYVAQMNGLPTVADELVTAYSQMTDQFKDSADSFFDEYGRVVTKQADLARKLAEAVGYESTALEDMDSWDVTYKESLEGVQALFEQGAYTIADYAKILATLPPNQRAQVEALYAEYLATTGLTSAMQDQTKVMDAASGTWTTSADLFNKMLKEMKAMNPTTASAINSTAAYISKMHGVPEIANLLIKAFGDMSGAAAYAAGSISASASQAADAASAAKSYAKYNHRVTDGKALPPNNEWSWVTWDGAKAGGGDIPANSFSLVGDAGPELVFGPASVVSTSKTSQVLHQSQMTSEETAAILWSIMTNTRKTAKVLEKFEYLGIKQDTGANVR